MTQWLDSEGPLKPFILSSRIRLARNFALSPFPAAMSPEMAAHLIEQVRERVVGGPQCSMPPIGCWQPGR